MSAERAAPPKAGGQPGVARNAAAAVAYAASQTAIGLLMFSYLIRTLGAEVVGVWVSLMAAGMLACMADLALNHALVRAVPLARHADAAHGPNEVIETLVWASTSLCGLSLALLHMSFPVWSPWLSLPPAVHEQALSLLPFMTLGLWLNRLSDAFAGALEGFQAYVVRSLAGIGGFVLGLALTITFAPVWGIRGAALAFVLQNLALCLVTGFLLQRCSPGLRWFAPRLRKAVLMDGVRYGLSIQLLVFCYLVIENGTKLLLVRGGFLAGVSYFDLAFRIGKGLRGLLSSALRVLVPKLVSALHIEGQRDIIYGNSFSVIVAVAVPIYVGLLTGAQGLSWLVVGRYEPVFITAIVLGLVPWLSYCLIDPALNNAMATGRMRWALYGHLFKVVLASALLTLPVFHDSVQGLFGAVALAMVAGSLAMLVAVHRLEGLSWRLLAPGPTLLALLFGGALGLIGALDTTLWTSQEGAAHAGALAAGFGLYVLCVLRWHPGGQRLLALVSGLLARQGREFKS